jgi:hypothetical protein
MPWARIGELVGHDDLMTTARTYTHVVADEGRARLHGLAGLYTERKLGRQPGTEIAAVPADALGKGEPAEIFVVEAGKTTICFTRLPEW